MKSRSLIAILIFITLTPLLAFFSTNLKTWRFAAGFNGGTYFEIAKSIDETGFAKVKTLETTGTLENIAKVANQEADLGLAQLDIISNSILVTNDLKLKTKVALPIYREEVHILVKDPKIKSIADLKGRSISIGKKNSGTAVSAEIILIALRLKKSMKINNYSAEFALDLLKKSQIDAVMIVAGAPIQALVNDSEGVRLLSFSSKEMQTLTSDFFPYKKAIIREKTYPWSGPVQTISVTSVIIVNAGMPEEDLSYLINSIFKYKRTLAKKHSKWAELDLEYALNIAEALQKDAHANAFKILRKLKK